MDKYIHIIGKSSLVLMIILYPIWMITYNNPLFYNKQLMEFGIIIGWCIALFISKAWVFILCFILTYIFATRED